jgi:hypothetical protein
MIPAMQVLHGSLEVLAVQIVPMMVNLSVVRLAAQ